MSRKSCITPCTTHGTCHSQSMWLVMTLCNYWPGRGSERAISDQSRPICFGSLRSLRQGWNEGLFCTRVNNPTRFGLRMRKMKGQDDANFRQRDEKGMIPPLNLISLSTHSFSHLIESLMHCEGKQIGVYNNPSLTMVWSSRYVP